MPLNKQNVENGFSQQSSNSAIYFSLLPSGKTWIHFSPLLSSAMSKYYFQTGMRRVEKELMKFVTPGFVFSPFSAFPEYFNVNFFIKICPSFKLFPYSWQNRTKTQVQFNWKIRIHFLLGISHQTLKTKINVFSSNVEMNLKTNKLFIVSGRK